MSRHLDGCELCRSWYRQSLLEAALETDPVPEPSAGFVDRVLSEAARGSVPQRRRPAYRGFAAGVVVAAAVAAAWFSAPALRDAGDTAPAPAPRIVKVVIDTQDDRRNALLTVELTEGLELDGFGDRQYIEWRADLPKGRNLLALPVRIKAGTGGDLRVAMSYGGETRTEMRIPVDA